MKFSELVCDGAIVPELESSERDAIIQELVDSLVSSGDIKKKDAKNVYKMIMARENEASTGIGKGVAVPHVKHKGASGVVVAIGISRDGIDFASLDKQPVYSVILMVSPAGNPDEHLKAMELVFKNLQKEDFRRFLSQAKGIDDIRELLREVDEGEL